jgi:uncharacterized protein
MLCASSSPADRDFWERRSRGICQPTKSWCCRELRAKLTSHGTRGLGGAIGHGRQGISWIHELDLNRLFERAIEDREMQGLYIATAPNPVSQREFMRELRRALQVPFGLPAFAWMVRIAAPLLATDPELAIYGRYLISRRLAEAGFVFRFPKVGEALDDLMKRTAA